MQENKVVYVVTKAEKSNGLAALMTLFIPGAGHMYKERVGEGLCWFVFVLIAYIFVIPGLILHFICILSAISNTKAKAVISSEVFHQAEPKDVEDLSKLAKNLSSMTETFIDSVKKSHDLFKRDLITDDEFKSSKKEAIDKALDCNTKPLLNDFLTAMIPLIDAGAITKVEIADIKARYHLYKEVG